MSTTSTKTVQQNQSSAIPNPLVSICLPVFNAAPYLLSCLESIAKQTYSPIELIIVDDASTDSSWDIISIFAQNKSWVKAVRNATNQGVSDSFNRSVSLSTGSYIARIDADDIMHHQRIAKQLRFLQENPHVVIVGGQCRLINSQGKIIGKKTFPLHHPQIYDMLFRTVPMQQPTIMINRTLLPTDFIYGQSKYSPAEDYGLFFAAAQYGQFANLSEVTLYYREHTTNISLTNPKFTFRQIWKARLDGLRLYHYKPSFWSLVTVLLQTIAVTLLPSQWIYPLHQKLRKMK